MKNESDRSRLRPLLERADVMVEQFRPGVMERLGLGYEAVRKINPRIVYCSISGYGQQGPRAGEAGHDINYIGLTGLLALQPGPIEKPVVPPALVADIGGGTLPAVINILLACASATRPGEGVYLDIAMTDAMFTFAWYALRDRARDREVSRAGRNARWSAARRAISSIRRATASSSPAARWSRNSGSRSATRSGLPAPLMNDLRRSGGDARPPSRRSSRARPPTHWRPKFAAADCCVTIVASLEEALHDPHFVERGLFAHQVIEAASGKTMPALPVPIAPRCARAGRAREAGADKLGRATTDAAEELKRFAAHQPRLRGGLQRLRASRRGAAARSGRADRARSRARPAAAGSRRAACD